MKNAMAWNFQHNGDLLVPLMFLPMILLDPLGGAAGARGGGGRPAASGLSMSPCSLAHIHRQTQNNHSKHRLKEEKSQPQKNKSDSCQKEIRAGKFEG